MVDLIISEKHVMNQHSSQDSQFVCHDRQGGGAGEIDTGRIL